MNSSHSTIRIIAGMEYPVPIGVNTVKPPLENSFIKTWNNESMKYHITQYDMIIPLVIPTLTRNSTVSEI